MIIEEGREKLSMKEKLYYDNYRWVSPMNFLEESWYNQLPKEIQIHDVTLRDGEQTCGLVWREDERVRIAEALSELGVASIELGMPAISDEIIRAGKDLAGRKIKSEIVAFARAMKKDLELSLNTGAQRVIVEHAVNEVLNKYVYNVGKAELIAKVCDCVAYLKEKNIKVTFMGWDATRASLDYVLEIFSEIAIKSKPYSIVFVDSFGVATPFTIYFIFKKLRSLIPPETKLEFHVHNEFGLAMGSVLAAAAGGATVFHTSINGLGERTGNVATEQVAAAFEILLNIKTGIDLSKIYYVSKLVQDISRISPGYNSPVVGERLFWVESGVVVDAMVKLNKAGIKAAMTPYLPQLIGREGPVLKMGAFSGKASVEYFLEKHNISASDEDIEKITDRIRSEGRIRRAVLEERDVLRIVKETLG